MIGAGSRLVALARVVALTGLGALAAVITAGDVWARDCNTMTGPARTDCFIVQTRLHGYQSAIAAGVARQRADEGLLRAATGTSRAPKARRAKPRKRASSP
jgi:hypothetical protein